MLQAIKEMTGIKRIIFETLCVMLVTVSTYVITYSITGSAETSAFAAAAFAAFAVVAFATHEYKVRWWKVFLVYLTEGLLLFACFTYLVPYSTIVLLCVVSLVFASFVGVFYLKRYLKNNSPPPEPCPVEQVRYYGNHLLRMISIKTKTPAPLEPLWTRIHRYAYNKLISKKK